MAVMYEVIQPSKHSPWSPRKEPMNGISSFETAIAPLLLFLP